MSCFPSFLGPEGNYAGYGNRSAAERLNHPLLYNPFRPAADGRSFAASNMEALLRYADTGSPALTSELFRLCPTNFTDPRIRSLVTTHSFDVDRPGVAPWIYNPHQFRYQTRPTGGSAGGSGQNDNEFGRVQRRLARNHGVKLKEQKGSASWRCRFHGPT